MKKFKEPTQGSVIRNRESYYATDATSIEGIDISLFGGNVVLLGEKNRATIEVEMQWGGKGRSRFFPRIIVDHERMKIVGWRISAFKNQKHAYVLQIRMPLHLQVKVRLFAGTLFVSGLTGKLDARVRIGEIGMLVPSAEKVFAKVGIGSITIKGGIASLQARTHIGDIQVSIPDMATVSKLHMRVTAIGDIALWLPDGINKKKVQNGPIVNTYGADMQARVLLGDIAVMEK